ncbi:MAG: TlpA family protein disulfide reductase [Gammaproteobacteria bacterium]|nr:TlpA family protein disulfide reductase [Gammaproteobacteria bacterium]
MMRARWLFSMVAFLTFLVGFGSWLAHRDTGPGVAAVEISPAALYATAFRDPSGAEQLLGRYQGRWLVLNFWATWCAPCREEMPVFSTWQQTYGARGLSIVGVSMDDGLGAVRRLLAQNPVSYPVIMGDARLGERFGGVLGLPLSYLLDGQGRVVARYQGEGSLAAIESRLQSLVADLHH